MWTVFRQQIVFYPLLFIATTVLLVFGGGGNPARSVHTTIAGSWATILGVVFSMTMIVLQLASTAFTSEVVSRIKRATISQVTLGCFVGVVTCDLNENNYGPNDSIQLGSVFHATAASDGYVRFIDWRLLARVLRHVLETSELQATIKFQSTVGDSATRGASVACIRLWPENEQVGRNIAARVQTVYEISNQRGADRDPVYAVEQLTAIGLKVLQRGDVDVADQVLNGLTVLYGSAAQATMPNRFTVRGVHGVAIIEANLPDVRSLISRGIGHLMAKVVQQQDGTVVDTFFEASGALLDRLVHECGEEDLTILLDTLRAAFQRLLEAPLLASEVLRGVPAWMNVLSEATSNNSAAASCLARFLASCRQDAYGHPDLQRALTHPRATA